MKTGNVTGNDSRRGPVRWAQLVMVASALSAILLVVARFPLNADVAWFMSMARSVLAGDRLYETVIEVNPPLTVYALMPAVALSDVTGLADSTSVIMVFTMMASLLVIWSVRLLGFKWSSGRASWWIVLLAFAVLIVPASDFGQREHLMLLLILPFTLLKWRRVSDLPVGVGTGTAAGVLAGLGFAIKPYFLLLWLFLEVFDWLRTRARGWRIRSESIAVLSVHAAYVLLVGVVHPEYFSMIQNLAPLYRRFSADTYRFLFIGYFTLPLLLALVAGTASKAEPPDRDLASVFLWVGCAGFLVALIQGKGWRYHSLPMIIATVIAWGALFEHSARVLAGRVGSDRPRAFFVFGLLLICAWRLQADVSYSLSLAETQRARNRQFQEDVARYSPDSILVLGDVVSDAFPLTNSVGASSTPPFSSMWWLRVLYGTSELPRVPLTEGHELSIEHQLRRILVDYFVTSHPDLVLVDTLKHARFGGQRFPYIDYFSKDPAFARAWRGYVRVGTTAHFTVWQVADRPRS